MLILIFKALLVILLNIIIPVTILFLIKQFLFYPKAIYFRGKRLIGTPGFIYRKKEWLINKLETIFHKFLFDCENEEDPNSFVSKWETKIYKAVWEKTEGIDQFRFIPKKFKTEIRSMIASLVYELVKQFFRSFIPYLIEKYQLEKYIDLVNQKLDIDTVAFYFRKYVYKYIMLFLLAFYGLIGIFNMIIFLILR